METLVFVHGHLGGGSQWADQSAVFGDRFQVFAPDLPGFGERRHLDAPERIKDFALFVLDELSSLGVDRFHLVGHSMGGMIVQEMTTLAPKRVDRLVLYGTGPVGPLPGRFEPISESKRRAAEDGVEATGRRISATWFMEGEKAERYHVCANLAVGVTLQAMLAGLSAMDTWSGKAELPHIKSPTLVLWGDGDRTYPWSQPEQLWKEIPNTNLAVVPGCAHAVHLEKPDIFNAVLMDFISAK
ncbi:MAG: alpha/beta hydrolase [Rhodospirillaceae bacterium]|nr:alpha/beta hydrolase [Rhodospirillaceae bacterium]